VQVRVPAPSLPAPIPATEGFGIEVGGDGAQVAGPGGIDASIAPPALPADPALPGVGGGATAVPAPASEPSAATPSPPPRDASANAGGSERVDAMPAGVRGALRDETRSGIWSTLGSAAASYGPWLVLLALALVTRLVAASALRGARVISSP
jgi:hypothetical protein